MGWRGGQSYVGWVLVGDDRALGDGRASVGKDCVVVRASGGGVVGGAGFGGCEWLRACWLARQLQFRSKTHAQPWPPRQAGRQASKQARLASHTQVPHRLTATSQPARVDPSPLVGYRIRPVRKTVRFPDARTSIDARRSCVSSRCGICLWHYYHLSAIIHSHTQSVSASRVFASHQQRASLASLSPQTLGRGDPGTRVGLAYHSRPPMTAPDRAAWGYAMFIYRSKSISPCAM